MKSEQWQIDGSAAELYERYVVGYILAPWTASLVDAARLSPGERVLDVACGTGVVTRIAAERAGPLGSVIGLDLNAGMLAVARSMPAAQGAPVQWVQRSALDLGLPDGSIDVVLCQQGLQFFPDRALALREMHRVLRKGGRLALSVWKNAGIYNSAVGAALAECIAQDVADRFCASRNVPSVDEIRCLVEGAGFLDVQLTTGHLEIHLPPPDTFALFHLASTPVASVLAGVDANVRKKIGGLVARQLHEYVDGDGVTYPEESVLVTARC
jgi:ubiquinone/menaquinone biosynthesis C-methylase UbiE